ncbi:MAG: hypothetical protein JNJ46_12425 [Myxococcales bacterium]|nr:hypothetical protein [Myxococcales bacterium]
MLGRKTQVVQQVGERTEPRRCIDLNTRRRSVASPIEHHTKLEVPHDRVLPLQ